MVQVKLELENSLARKIDSLIRYFGSTDIMFDKFVEYHRKNAQREIVRIQSDLDVYEEKYQMDSDSFYASFENGELEDSKDFILWSGIYEMQLSSKERLKELL